MSGLCAAIAAARNGARTALVHDRPVLGGNASSEIRMSIGGAHGEHNKETGLLEEIQLDDFFHNPEANYAVWDGVLWGKANFQPNLTLFLNCSCAEAEMDGGRIVSISAWQLTSQTWHTVRARQFIDCSGDSILAPLTGALFRAGREAREEYGEDIEPFQADAKTMGNSILIQWRDTGEPHPFVAPAWAYQFDGMSDRPQRMKGIEGHNFWWLEVGGLQDTIADAEPIRDELMRIAYGIVDYIKNRAPERAGAANWHLEWIGALPGKRESRRYIGDHVLTQNDVRAGGVFEDMIAYGGWAMDDHHPAGLYYPDNPTIFHSAPSPYGIPYRSLYSRNVGNLLFAGRNISVTHAALSSTRVMATCSMLGQAAGTAAALCVRNACEPRELSSGERLRELQATLMDDDCWLPGLRREVSALARAGKLTGEGECAELLRDGLDRDRKGEPHAWSGPVGASVGYEWPEKVSVAGARLVFDSDLQMRKHMPWRYPVRRSMPGALVKAFRLEALGDNGRWTTVYAEPQNIRRLVVVPVGVETRGLRLVVESTWGAPAARIFAFDPLEECRVKISATPRKVEFDERCRSIDPKDIEPPQGVVR